MVERGARLAFLAREEAIERAAVSVSAALDPQLSWGLPTLRASAARTVMFMFNTFESLAPLRAAVGDARFAFGYPDGVFALLVISRKWT
ncbi:MAG TPA: ketopantoate reductase family protein, partial [Polyangiales bacterium]|nr:ketopantoate reductase family protein [Polyangiales bacterium]